MRNHRNPNGMKAQTPERELENLPPIELEYSRFKVDMIDSGTNAPTHREINIDFDYKSLRVNSFDRGIDLIKMQVCNNRIIKVVPQKLGFSRDILVDEKGVEASKLIGDVRVLWVVNSDNKKLFKLNFFHGGIHIQAGEHIIISGDSLSSDLIIDGVGQNLLDVSR